MCQAAERRNRVQTRNVLRIDFLSHHYKAILCHFYVFSPHSYFSYFLIPQFYICNQMIHVFMKEHFIHFDCTMQNVMYSLYKL